MLADPTMDAALSVWGESVSLQRDPVVTMSAVFSEPDFLSQLGSIAVDGVDGVLQIKATSIASLNIQPKERFLIRGNPFHVLAVKHDDGAGAMILLKRSKA